MRSQHLRHRRGTPGSVVPGYARSPLVRQSTERRLLGETYYHSVAGQFRNPGEFEAEILMHRDLMKDYFSSVPTTFAHTDYPITPATAEVLRDNEIRAAIIEGDSGPALDSDPNHVYTYNGLPILITHCNLADDIAVRFSWRDWDRWPLTADRYAEWISSRRASASRSSWTTAYSATPSEPDGHPGVPACSSRSPLRKGGG